jgi:multidrug resistance efflux pump
MKKRTNIILIAAALIIFIGLGVGYWFYWQSNTYLSTENAKVTAKLYSIPATGAGKIMELNAVEGDAVSKNQVIARIENAPYVKSPIDGTIAKMDTVEGGMASVQTVMAVVADTDNVYVEANIEETDIRRLKENQKVEVSLDAFGGKKFKAHIEEIDLATTSAMNGGAMSLTTSGTYTKVTQLIPVKISVDEAVDLHDVIGTNATVKIKVR